MTENLSIADELKKFKELLEAGIITQEEFDGQKEKLLSGNGFDFQPQQQNNVYGPGVKNSKYNYNAQQTQPNITVQNTNVNNIRVGYRRHSLLFDLFMICITGGLWLIWMIIRPKY